MLCLQSRRCGFILISRGLSSFFTVAAVLLPPRVLWGGEQGAQQREKQIPQHFTMWVRLRCLWQSVSARIWLPMLCLMAETEGKPTLPFPSFTDDHSRVVLSHDGHPCSDYINASYINVKVRRRSSFTWKIGKVLIIFTSPLRVLKKRTSLSPLKVKFRLQQTGLDFLGK